MVSCTHRGVDENLVRHLMYLVSPAAPRWRIRFGQGRTQNLLASVGGFLHSLSTSISCKKVNKSYEMMGLPYLVDTFSLCIRVPSLMLEHQRPTRFEN
jgi:hypothetical protein